MVSSYLVTAYLFFFQAEDIEDDVDQGHAPARGRGGRPRYYRSFYRPRGGYSPVMNYESGYGRGGYVPRGGYRGRGGFRGGYRGGFRYAIDSANLACVFFFR